MQKNNNTFIAVAKDWRWLKLLIPFWTIIGGIPMILANPRKTSTIAIILILALLVAMTATAFCIKCYIYYVEEMQKNNKELQDLNNEIEALNNAQKETKQQAIPVDAQHVNPHSNAHPKND